MFVSNPNLALPTIFSFLCIISLIPGVRVCTTHISRILRKMPFVSPSAVTQIRVSVITTNKLFCWHQKSSNHVLWSTFKHISCCASLCQWLCLEVIHRHEKKKTLIWTPTVVSSFTLPLSLTCLFSLPLFSIFREWGAKALQRIHAGHQKCGIKLDSSFALCNKQNSFHNLVPLQNLDVTQIKKKNLLGRLPTALS